MANAAAIFDPKLLALTFISALNGVFGFWVYFRNKNGAINRAYLAFVVSLVLWGLTQWAFFVTPDLAVAKLMMQLCHFSAILIAFSFLHFANVYPFQYFKYHPVLKIFLLVMTGLAAFIIFSPDFLIKRAFINNGLMDFEHNVLGHLVFAFYFMSFVAAIFYVFIAKYMKSSGLARLQIKYVMLGCLGALTLGVLSNLLLPVIGWDRLIWLGPYFTVLITVFVGRTINLTNQLT